MKASYRVKFLDIILFNIYHWFHSPTMLAFIAIEIIITSVLNLRVVSETANEYSFIVRALTFVTLELPFILGIFVILVVTIVVFNISKMNKTVLTDCVVTLGPDCITTETKYTRAEYKWNAIQKVARNKDYLFLYIMQHSALIIPKRAFQHDDQVESFWRECEKGMRTA